MSGTLKVIRWYPRVLDDFTNVPDACEYYKGVILEGEKYVSPVGDLGRLHLEQSGLQSYFGGFYKDAMGVAKYLEELYDMEHAKKSSWFHSPTAKQEYGTLTATAIKNYADSDEFIWTLKQFHRTAEYYKDQLENVFKAIISRGYFIQNYFEIKKHNLEFVVVDARREQVNDD